MTSRIVHLIDAATIGEAYATNTLCGIPGLEVMRSPDLFVGVMFLTHLTKGETRTRCAQCFNSPELSLLQLKYAEL